MADKVLLITGASSGIGAATAKMAAAAGWRLVLAARSEDKVRALADQAGGPDRALAVRCDVTSFADQEAMVRAALDRFGQIDAVFANAGRPGGPGGFTAADPEVWRAMILTNVLGLGFTLRATIKAVKKTRGHILITGSVAGRRTIAGSMYGASKWAANAIGYNLREELKGSGVRVTLIEPGMVETAFFDQPKPDALKPDDIARAVLYALEQPAQVDVHEVLVLPTPPAED